MPDVPKRTVDQLTPLMMQYVSDALLEGLQVAATVIGEMAARMRNGSEPMLDGPEALDRAEAEILQSIRTVKARRVR